MGAHRINGDTATIVREKEFIMQRIFDAPRELVFEAFTKPEHVSRWWAPHPYTIPVCRIDLRPGGLWHYCMRSPEGELHWAKAVYQEIERPERIVYIGNFADEEGNTVPGVPEHRGTVTFTEYEGKTRLNLRVEFETAEDRAAATNMGMAQGLEMALNQLFDLLEESRRDI